MHLDILAFLKNTLSGAREDRSVVQEAIVVPVGQRTTLAAARRDVDSTFDKLERLLLRDDEKPRVAARRTAAAASARAGEGRAGRASGGVPGGDVGTLAAVATFMIPQAYDAAKGIVQQAVDGAAATYESVAKTAEDVYATTAKYAVDKLDQARDAAGAAWAWVGVQATKTRDAVEYGARRVTDGIQDFAGDARDGAQSGSAAVQIAADRGVTPVTSYVAGNPSATPSADVPPDATAKSTAATHGFWREAYAGIKRWLWSIFGIFDDLSAGTGPDKGASGLSTPGSWSPTARPKGLWAYAGAGAPGAPSPFTTSGDKIPGTDEPTTGVRAVDDQMAKMSQTERAEFRSSGKMESAVRDAYFNNQSQSLALPGSAAFKFGAPQGQGSTYGVSQSILDLAARGEAAKFEGGGYNTVIGGNQDPNMTKRTVAEQLAWGADRIHRGLPTDSGRWQITHLTLSDEGLLKSAGVSMSDKFDADTQRKIAAAIIRTTGGDPSRMRGRFLSLRGASDSEIRGAWNAGDASAGKPAEMANALPAGSPAAMVFGGGVRGASGSVGASDYFSRGVSPVAPTTAPVGFHPSATMPGGAGPTSSADYFSRGMSFQSTSTAVSPDPVEPASTAKPQAEQPPASEPSHDDHAESADHPAPSRRKAALKLLQQNKDTGFVVVADSEFA